MFQLQVMCLKLMLDISLVFGLILGARLCHQFGGDMDLYQRSIRSIVICCYQASDAEQHCVLKRLQIGQDEFANHEIHADKALDMADHYSNIIKGLKRDGKKTANDSIIIFANSMRWLCPTNAWTLKTVQSCRLVLSYFVEDLVANEALRRFNVHHGTNILCRGFFGTLMPSSILAKTKSMCL